MVTAASVASHEGYILYYLIYLLLFHPQCHRAPLQFSDAVGAVNDGAAVQFIVLFAGTCTDRSVPAYRLL
jgi:hypothetical protein